jgi:hypothetical protein
LFARVRGMKILVLTYLILTGFTFPALSGSSNAMINSFEKKEFKILAGAAEGRSVPAGTLLIVIKGFVPNPMASSQVVVTTKDSSKEIGRFGIFPNSQFGNSDAEMAMFIPIPRGLELSQGNSINLLLTPVDGTAQQSNAAATISIGGIYTQ